MFGHKSNFTQCCLFDYIFFLFFIYCYRECPVELEEAASGILYAASRCGDFPEIQEIRTILTSRFGKEFAARAIELRNNCKVHPKVYIFHISISFE
jgi:vacuolar protein sorting-associated protein IST1